jgi:branched-chain amino acid transport system ATP-binding protein
MALLEARKLSKDFGGLHALQHLDLAVETGEIVAIIGPNGAGKTSTLRALSGLVRPSGGRIVFRGVDISRWRAHRIVTLGLSHAPEGRRLFPQMTVLDNLRMGAYRRRDGRAIEATLAEVLERFPRLGERRRQLAGTLSGGEQQMLTIGRALMSSPTLLVLDEPSFGLAPLIVREIGTIVESINRERNVAVLLVEQNARMALAVAARAYVMETGRIALSGPAAELRESPHVRAAYLGG